MSTFAVKQQFKLGLVVSNLIVSYLTFLLFCLSVVMCMFHRDPCSSCSVIRWLDYWFKIWPIRTNKNMPNRTQKNTKVGSKFCLIIHQKIAKDCYKFLSQWCNFNKSGHTARQRKRTRSSLGKELSRACRITSPFNNKLGCF